MRIAGIVYHHSGNWKTTVSAHSSFSCSARTLSGLEFVLPDESGLELLVLSAAPGSPSEDGLRLLATLAADGDARPVRGAHR